MFMIKLSQATIGHEEKEALARVIDNQYLGMGVETRAFEDELKQFIDKENPPALATVNTGTSALHLAVQALGIGSGDEVLVPTITYVASFQAVSATGATPVAVDVDARTGCLSVEDARKRITARTKAIMTVHYASGFGDLAGVYALAAEHKLRVIEDAAHSFGGFYAGKRVGATGDVVCFSFDGIKNLTCGEGGAVVSRDAAVIERVADLRLLAIAKDTEQRKTFI
jgi:dTDP-4-amino-4,6-dideoxygalactose transaminase